MNSEHQVMDAGAMERSLTRIAHEILERNAGAEPLGLIGIHTRGVPMAQRLDELIRGIEPDREMLPHGALDISFHRDDIASNVPVPQGTDISYDIEGHHLIVVDDVFYTGRTVRAAMNALLDLGRASSIQLAVLVDRGHRELPIRADYVGKNIPTSAEEEVRCCLAECDGRDEVVVCRKA